MMVSSSWYILFPVITFVLWTQESVCKITIASLYFCLLIGNLMKHMKSKAHGKKCQSMGVSESSVDEPESEETGTGWGGWNRSSLACFLAAAEKCWHAAGWTAGETL